VNKIINIVHKSAVLRKIALFFLRLFRSNNKFPGSSVYWEIRYQKGKSSGAGSYNRLAIFKAEVINSYIKEKQINTVIELGCGDGHQIELCNYPSYYGLDISSTAISLCQLKFKDDSTKSFYVYDANRNLSTLKSELSLSLDVLYHLIEETVFEKYMYDLFNLASRYVIIYSSNYDTPQFYHEKDRNFTNWIETNINGWKLGNVIKNKYPYDVKDPDNTSKADFFLYEKIIN